LYRQYSRTRRRAQELGCLRARVLGPSERDATEAALVETHAFCVGLGWDVMRTPCPIKREQRELGSIRIRTCLSVYGTVSEFRLHGDRSRPNG
jgi:hypothetical protein